MSKNINSVSVKSALNLNNEETIMLDNSKDWEIGQMEIDEKDLELAHQILQAALCEEEISHDESPKTFNGIDWDKMAHLVEVQLFMEKVMSNINQIDERLARAKAGEYLPRDVFMLLVDQKKSCWSKWNQGKELSAQIVNGDKQMWGVFFNIEDKAEFLKNHLEMEVSQWNTFGRDDEEDESFEKYHVAVIDQLAEAHLVEMREYTKEVDVDWTYQDKRLSSRLENKNLDEQSLFAVCPF